MNRSSESGAGGGVCTSGGGGGGGGGGRPSQVWSGGDPLQYTGVIKLLAPHGGGGQTGVVR